MSTLKSGHDKRVRRVVLLSFGILLALLVLGGIICAVWGRAGSEAGASSGGASEGSSGKSLSSCRSTLERLEVLERQLKERDNLSVTERHQAIISTLAEAVNDSLCEFTRLSPSEKASRARELQRDAEQTQAYFRGFSRGKQRQAVVLLMTCPEGKAQVSRAMSIVGNQLTPSDLALLGPTIRVWASMIKGS